jgi:hypothetical protein
LALKEEEKRELSLRMRLSLKQQVLDSMIDRKLVKQKIKELNIVITEEEVASPSKISSDKTN